MLTVSLVEYDPTKKVKLIDDLKKFSDSDKFIYDYLQWQCIKKKGVTVPLNFDITNLFRNAYNRNFIIIGIPNDRSDNQKNYPSKFDIENIKNASDRINQTPYPIGSDRINACIDAGNLGNLFLKYLKGKIISKCKRL